MEGTIIGGRYEYIRSLGKGGNGNVFLCFDRKLQKEWAMKELYVWKEVDLQETDTEEKTIDRKNSSAEILQIAELELLKTISCNLFPRIVDIVEERDKRYLVMDYVEGMTLKEKMQRQKLTEKEVYSWAIQIAKALLYLHRMSPPILYMDCKPENIMLTPQGEIRLVDLGSVYICGLKKQSVSGTRFFSPAEQQNIRQKEKKEICETEAGLDVRSDIYAFGMTLYYLLAGKKKIYRHRGRLSVKHANPAVSDGMNEIIAKCTEKEPAKRLQSMEEVLYQLAHIKEINNQLKTRHQLVKGGILLAKIASAMGILIGFGIYANRGEEKAFILGIFAMTIFFLLCRRRHFTIYEIKKECFCGSGKRILFYSLVVSGVLRIMTVSAFANEGRNNVIDNERIKVMNENVQELAVTVYDWKGRKLLIKEGEIWTVSEDILLAIPLEELEVKEGMITIIYEGEKGEKRKKYTLSCCRKE